MADPQEAAEHLRVIRHLMERATVYRAISAPTALAAALLSLALALGIHLGSGNRSTELSPDAFYGAWVGVLVVVAAFNTWLLWRDARARGVSMVSSSAIHAGKALVPPLFAGAVISLLVLRESVIIAVLCWIVCYGLALLATQSFAPRSMKLLGCVFLIAGLGMGIARHLGFLMPSPEEDLLFANGVMAGTFGFFHLVYALAVGLKTGFRARPPEGVSTLLA
jgi:hypothetical protein